MPASRSEMVVSGSPVELDGGMVWDGLQRENCRRVPGCAAAEEITLGMCSAGWSDITGLRSRLPAIWASQAAGLAATPPTPPQPSPPVISDNRRAEPCRRCHHGEPLKFTASEKLVNFLPPRRQVSRLALQFGDVRGGKIFTFCT